MNYIKLLEKGLDNEIDSINPSDVSYLVDKFLGIIFNTIQEYCDMSNKCHNDINYIRALDLLKSNSILSALHFSAASIFSILETANGTSSLTTP